MKGKYSLRFWIVFWLVSMTLLVGWYFFLQVKNNGFGAVSQTARFLPVSEELRSDIQAVLDIADLLMVRDGVERTYLGLFQNNWELRPGGGFIGSFGVIKVKNGAITSIEVHDTANFDGRIPSTIAPPYPMKETLSIDSWKLRDSNYSPDFPTNVENALMFYEMGGGEERFDGVIAITTDVLLSALEITGPVEVEGYPGTYGADNAIELLQYQVEVGYREQDIEKGDRKGMMNALAKSILEEVGPLDVSRKIQLARSVLDNLHSKDIQLFFFDPEAQSFVKERQWGGEVDTLWKNDYLMIVDANLAAYKTDRLIDRSVSYRVDFSKEQPTVLLEITYTNNAQAKDWKTNDYQSYTRIYTPMGSWLEDSSGLRHGTQFYEEFGKKAFGSLIQVPIDSTKTFSFRYTLPKTIDGDYYDLKIQKQPGNGNVSYTVIVVDESGLENKYSFVLDRDILLSDLMK